MGHVDQDSGRNAPSPLSGLSRYRSTMQYALFQLQVFAFPRSHALIVAINNSQLASFLPS